MGFIQSKGGRVVKLLEILNLKCKKDIRECSNEEIYFALLETVQQLSKERKVINLARRNFIIYLQSF